MNVEERLETFFTLLRKEGLFKGILFYSGKQYRFDSITGKVIVESLKYIPDKAPSSRVSKSIDQKKKPELITAFDKDTETLKKKIQSSFKPGKGFGNQYKIISKIGQGGMGTVFKAMDNELNQVVAIKMIRPELIREAENIDRFKRELEIIRQINHENVIRIQNFGDVDGIKFMSMQYIEGISLLELIRSSGVLSTPDFMKISGQICRALKAIHEKKIIHRDLKPQNIMIDNNGMVYIMDFGLARSLIKPKITTTGQIVGTPEFMSPEQIQDQVTDHRTDIWSLGIMFYEMLTAELPFKGKTLRALTNSILSENPELPSRINPMIPKLVEKLILKCLNKNSDKRYSCIKEVEEELQKISKKLGYTDTGTLAVKLPTTKKREPEDNGKKIALGRGGRIYKKKRIKIRMAPRVVTFLFGFISLGLIAYVLLQNQNPVANGDKNSWEAAQHSDSLKAYQLYLKDFPRGRYKKKAEERISQIKQDHYQELLDRYKKLVANGQLAQALAVIRKARDYGDVNKSILLEKRVEQMIAEENKKQEEYGRLYELAQKNYKGKKFDSALRYISQSKEIQSTPELLEFEKKVMAEREEEIKNLNREYEKYLKIAKKRLSQKLFDQALENVKMARLSKNTRELSRLEYDIIQQKNNFLRSKTVKTLELVNLPVTLIRSYYEKLRRIEIQKRNQGTTITGRIFIKFGIDETGKVRLQDFKESQLTVKPFQRKNSLISLLKSRINSIILKPPTDKSGHKARITNWSLKYRVECTRDKIILNIYF